MNNIVAIFDDQGKLSESLEYYKRAVVIQQDLDDRGEEVINCVRLDITAVNPDDLARVENLLVLVVELMEDLEHSKLEAYRDGLARVRAKRQKAQKENDIG